jgi:hypothetical protein
MNNAGRSATAWARQHRRAQPWWRRILVALDLLEQPRAAANCEAGAKGERLTAELLAPLTAEGWHVLHDRAIPGSNANLDHILIPPHGQYVIVLDSKLWSRHKGTLNITRAGRLVHGVADRHKAITTVQWEADRAGDLLVVPAYPVIVMHSAPVAGGEVTVGGVVVADPVRLMSLLRVHAATGRPHREGAARLAARVARILPAYT